MPKREVDISQTPLRGHKFLEEARTGTRTGSFVRHIDPQQHNKLIKPFGNRYLLRCMINGHRTQPLFDSGAQVSILPKWWISQHEPKLKVRDVSELLDESDQLVLRTVDNSDLPFLGFVELPVQLLNWNVAQTLKVPFLVSDAQLDSVIIGYNVIEEILMNPSQYGLDKSNFLSSLQSLMPNVSFNKMKGIVKLIQTKNKDYFCTVKTPKDFYQCFGGPSVNIPCRVNTGPMKARSPVIFEPEIAGSLPDDLHVASSLLILKGGKSSKVSISVTNDTKSKIVLEPHTILGQLQLVLLFRH